MLTYERVCSALYGLLLLVLGSNLAFVPDTAKLSSLMEQMYPARREKNGNRSAFNSIERQKRSPSRILPGMTILAISPIIAKYQITLFRNCTGVELVIRRCFNIGFRERFSVDKYFAVVNG